MNRDMRNIVTAVDNLEEAMRNLLRTNESLMGMFQQNKMDIAMLRLRVDDRLAADSEEVE